VGAAEQFEAIDRVLLPISEADQRAAEGAQEVAKTGGEQHLVRLDQLNEAHMAEVEGVLFLMSGARRRAERATRDLAKDGAEPHLVEAMERAEREVEATIDAFFKSTYFRVPKDQLAISRRSPTSRAASTPGGRRSASSGRSG